VAIPGNTERYNRHYFFFFNIEQYKAEAPYREDPKLSLKRAKREQTFSGRVARCSNGNMNGIDVLYKSISAITLQNYTISIIYKLKLRVTVK
jgi:hypothetical protein